MIWFIVYCVICLGWGLLSNHLNLSFGDWEYWAVLAGLGMAYVCGAAN